MSAPRPVPDGLSVEITLDESDLPGIFDHPLVRALLEHSPDGALAIDVRTRAILAINRRARELLGYGEQDVVGQRCKNTVNSPDCGRRCLVNAAIELPGGGRIGEVFYRGREGRARVHAQTRVILIRSPSGEPLAGIELFRDVSEVHRMERALRSRRSLRGIVGQAPVMQALYELVEQVAPFDIPVLITGESGVGKERFADAVQALSERGDGPYVKVNCAALNPSLIESELFGHRRGAFTGANRDRRGSFEEADGGTILLDEIAELPLELQPKLLRVLQQGEVQRVGDERPRRVDVRILAATNRDVEQAVREGRFREDLYYRLAGVRLHVPPLRERLADLPELVHHFLDRFEEEALRRGRPRGVNGITDEALDALAARSWPGNVRELENALRLAWIRTPAGEPITPDRLAVPGASLAAPASPGRVRTLAELEAEAIDQAMRASRGNVSEAARMLGINRTTLWRKLRRRPPASRPDAEG